MNVEKFDGKFRTLKFTGEIELAELLEAVSVELSLANADGLKLMSVEDVIGLVNSIKQFLET